MYTYQIPPEKINASYGGVNLLAVSRLLSQPARNIRSYQIRQSPDMSPCPAFKELLFDTIKMITESLPPYWTKQLYFYFISNIIFFITYAILKGMSKYKNDEHT